MPKTVEIPSIGTVEFPDEMDDAAIGTAAQQLYDERNPPAKGIVQRLKEGIGSGLDALGNAIRPGLEALGAAEEENTRANDIAGQAIRDALAKGVKMSQAGLETLSKANRAMPGPVPGAGAADLAGAVAHPFQGPLDSVGRIPQDPNRSAAGQVAAGAANVALNAASPLVSPAGAVLAATAGLPVTVQRIIAGAFAIDMGRQLPDLAARAGEALAGDNLQQKVEAVGDLAATAGFAGMAAKHAGTPKSVALARGLAGQLDQRPGAPTTGAIPQTYIVDETPSAPGFRYRGQELPVQPGAEATPDLPPDPRPPAPPSQSSTPTEAIVAAETVMDRVPPADVPADPAAVAARAAEIRGEAEAGGPEAAVASLQGNTPTERAAVRIGLGLTDAASEALKRGDLEVEDAHAIAKAAPGDGPVQGVGLAVILEGGTADDAVRAMEKFRREHGPTADPVDAIKDSPQPEPPRAEEAPAPVANQEVPHEVTEKADSPNQTGATPEAGGAVAPVAPEFDAEKWLKVPAEDPGPAREFVRSNDLKIEALREEQKALLANAKAIESKVLVQSGPRYKRGEIKKSAKRLDVQAWRKLQERDAEIDREIEALRKSSQEYRDAVDKFSMAKVAGEPGHPMLRRLATRQRLAAWLGEQDVPREAYLATEKAAAEEIRAVYPDATPAEIAAIAPRLVELAAQTDDLRGVLTRDPELDLNILRRRRITSAFKREDRNVDMHLKSAFIDYPEEVSRRAQEANADTRYRKDIKPFTAAETDSLIQQMHAAQDARWQTLKSEMEAERAKQEAEAAERGRQTEEMKRMVSEAQAVADQQTTKGNAKEIKTELVARLERALADAPEKSGEAGKPLVVTIAVPGDGVYVLQNAKAAIARTLERASKLHTESPKGPGKPGWLRVPKPTGDVTPEIWLASQEPTHVITVDGGKNGPIEKFARQVEVNVPGLKGFAFWLSTLRDAKEFTITEQTSGLVAGRGDTVASAIRNAEEAIQKAGIDRTEQAIREATKIDFKAKEMTERDRDLARGPDVPPEPTGKSGGAAGSPIALPPGTTPTTGQRMPVSMDPITSKRVDIPTIFRQIERTMQTAGSMTPIRAGRMGAMKRWASGFFRPRQEVIRLDSAFNLPTATHELAHDLAHSWWRRGRGMSPTSPGYSKAAGNWFRANVPAGVLRELHAEGTRLYGSRKPAAGYVEEGWAEFMRRHLTTDDVATVMPETSKWFRDVLSKDHPETARQLARTREMIDVWRGQGDIGRQQAMMKRYPGKVVSALRSLKKALSVQRQLEEFEPLARASKFWQDRHGSTLSPGEDPFMVATRVRGIAPSVMERFLHSGVLDIDGNPTGVKSLAEALTPVLEGIPAWSRMTHAFAPALGGKVRQRLAEFGAYLHARRTLERATKAQETGLSLDDARTIIARYDTPRFQIAAAEYYKWWDGVLDYFGGASPGNAALVKAVRAGSADYVPLPRVLDLDPSTRAEVAGQAGGGLRRMHGSGRPIYDVFESTLKVAQRLIEKAHKDLVADTVVKLAQEEGMGWMAEKVPIDQVRQTVSIERLRRELSALGVDTAHVPDGTLVEYYAQAKEPGGVDAVRPVRDAQGKVHWYALNPEVASVLMGIENPRVGSNLLLRFIAMTGRAFKMGTTSMSAGFQLVGNPLRDLPNYFMQVAGTGNPATSMTAYLASMADMFKASFGMGIVKPSAYWEALHDLGVPMANNLGHDIAQTRSHIRGMWHGKVLRMVTEPVNTFREMIGGMENVPRAAQLRIKAAEVGWRPGMPMTRDQAVAMTVAAKRVTVDFSAGGATGRTINLYVPFYNASIQGVRSMGRTLRAAADSRYAARNDLSQRQALARVAIGGMFMATQALANWYRNKDEEWYRALPWRERFLYTNIREDDGTVWRIPRPPEWGNLFMVAPEAIADSWYRQDPETAAAAVRHILATVGPVDLSSPEAALESVSPVALKAIFEQARNKDFFWNRPIVPAAEQDLPPGEQRGEQTSRLAKALGDAFPDTISPRRVDAAMRQFGGGALVDFVRLIGLGPQLKEREAEPADLPVAGRLFRRGGDFTAASRPLQEFGDLYAYWRMRSESKARPLDGREQAFWERLKKEHSDISHVRQMALVTRDLAPRRRLWKSAARWAQAAVDDAGRLGLKP